MELALGGLMFFAVLLLVIGYNAGQALDPVQARLQQIAAKPRNLEELELQRPMSERTLKPLLRAMAGLVSRFYPANTARSLELKLKKAGMETTSTEERNQQRKNQVRATQTRLPLPLPMAELASTNLRVGATGRNRRFPAGAEPQRG